MPPPLPAWHEPAGTAASPAPLTSPAPLAAGPQHGAAHAQRHAAGPLHLPAVEVRARVRARLHPQRTQRDARPAPAHALPPGQHARPHRMPARTHRRLQDGWAGGAARRAAGPRRRPAGHPEVAGGAQCSGAGALRVAAGQVCVWGGGAGAQRSRGRGMRPRTAPAPLPASHAPPPARWPHPTRPCVRCAVVPPGWRRRRASWRPCTSSWRPRRSARAPRRTSCSRCAAAAHAHCAACRPARATPPCVRLPHFKCT